MITRLASALIAVAMMGCGAAPEAARIAVPADTVNVNTTLVETIDVKVVDREGRPVARAPLEYVGIPDSVLLVGEHGGVQCRTNGVADVILTSGSLHSHATVRCNLISRFSGAEEVCMRVGGPKTPLRFAAYDSKGQVLAAPRVYVKNTDTTIVRLDHGMITAIRPGIASIGVSSGRHATGLTVRVMDSNRFAASGANCGSRFPGT